MPLFRPGLTRFAWLSIAAAAVTISLKMVAYLLTGSVGLLSDAIESLVNMVGAVMALSMLTVAARPADDEHAFGHGKAEYFSSGVEGALILVAAVSIAVASVTRLLSPRPVEQVGIGLAVSAVASLVNLGVARLLRRAATVHRSVTLDANASHLLTDVWTSAGVIAGVGAVGLTGWHPLDPIIALAVAVNILRTGVRIVGKSVLGLMDTALPPEEMMAVRRMLDRYVEAGVQFHAFRTRQSGARRFISFHVLVPGGWTVQRGHALLEEIERGIRDTVPNVTLLTHLESLDDQASWDDVELDRPPRDLQLPDVSRVRLRSAPDPDGSPHG